MKVILFGSNGMLGSYLKAYLADKYEVVPITRSDLDLSVIDEAATLQFLRNHVSKDDVIVNAAGLIKQREYALIDMIAVNSLFPNILAHFKKEVDCHVIHISTDCVYSGAKGDYIESDPHDCLDEYGKSKSLGEHPELTIIRTSILGEEKSNKRSLLEWVISNKGKTIDGYENHLWNGVTCLELSKLIATMIQTNEYWQGVRHVFSPSVVSKYELVTMINAVYGLGITIHKKKTALDCYRNLSTSFAPLITTPLMDQIKELKMFSL
jgi:dTDP-4-dehydrorhamnose reductase